MAVPFRGGGNARSIKEIIAFWNFFPTGIKLWGEGLGLNGTATEMIIFFLGFPSREMRTW